MCPVGMPATVLHALWEDFKENGMEWFIFICWEVPISLVKGE